MKVVTSLAFALASLLSASAFAADKAPADKLTPQQQKMSDCAKDAHAKSLKGDEYKSYMSTCMKGSDGTAAAQRRAKPNAAATTSQASHDGEIPADRHDGRGRRRPRRLPRPTRPQADGQKADPAAAQRSGSLRRATRKQCNAQQQKMKSCDADAKAKGLKGADRRNFMSTCLKGDSATTGRTRDTTTPPAKKSAT